MRTILSFLCHHFEVSNYNPLKCFHWYCIHPEKFRSLFEKFRSLFQNLRSSHTTVLILHRRITAYGMHRLNGVTAHINEFYLTVSYNTSFSCPNSIREISSLTHFIGSLLLFRHSIHHLLLLKTNFHSYPYRTVVSNIQCPDYSKYLLPAVLTLSSKSLVVICVSNL